MLYREASVESVELPLFSFVTIIPPLPYNFNVPRETTQRKVWWEAADLGSGDVPDKLALL